MAETTELIISNLKVHGSGVASCGSYPDVKISATIKFTRANPNDSTVNWEVSSISWSHPTSGKFGYKFRIYLYFYNDASRYELLMKNNTTASNWWNTVSLKKPSGSFTAGEGVSTITVAIQAHGGADSCVSGSDSHFCYGSSAYRNLKTYEVTLPSYAPYYTVSYNNNGGDGTIESQIKEPEQDLTLTTDIPSFPVTITYHDNPDRVETSERPFLYWLGSGTQYDPGDLYTIDASCEMVAQWGPASFTPVLPTKYVRITYVLNGGILNPAYTDIARTSLGYDPDPNVTSNPQYPNATPGTTTLKILGLYPVYGDATMPFASLPTPVNPGYRFEGWYYDAALQTPVETDISTSVDIILYASWTFIPIRKFDGSNWQEDDLYVWIFNGTVWQKIAPIYAFSGTEWVNMSGGPAPVEVTTAKAGVANFTTSLARPLVNLTAYFKATQEAGTPTPQSPKAISGVSAVSVFHRGANLFNILTKTDGKALKWGDGDTFNDVKSIVSDYIEVKEGVKFTSNYFAQWCCYDKNKNYLGNILSGALVTTSGADRVDNTIPTGYGIYYLRLGYRSALNNNEDMTEKTDIVLSVGNTALPYEPYNGSTTLINLGGTYYGGYVSQDKDGKRVLVVTHKIIDLGDISYSYNSTYSLFIAYLPDSKRIASGKGLYCLCNYFSSNYDIVWSGWANFPNYSVSCGCNYDTSINLVIKDTDYTFTTTFKNAMAGVKLVYELAEPFTVALPDGEPITAFNGVNNIYNNSSDSQVTFLATPQEAEAAQQRSLSKGSPSEEQEEEEEKLEEEPIEEPKDTGNER